MLAENPYAKGATMDGLMVSRMEIKLVVIMTSPQEGPGEASTVQIHSGPAPPVTRLDGTSRVRPAVEVSIGPGKTVSRAVS